MSPTRRFGQKLVFWLIISLTVSMVVLGVLNSLALRRLDADYTSLISRDLTAINLVRAVGRQSAESYRSLLNLVANRSPQDVEIQKRRFDTAVQENDRNFKGLDVMLSNSQARSHLERLSLRRAEYVECARNLVRLIDEGKIEEAEKYRVYTVRDLYDTYLSTQDELASVVHANAEERSKAFSETTSRWQLFSLGISTWPVLLLLIFAAGVISLLVWLGWGMPDEPA